VLHDPVGGTAEGVGGALGGLYYAIIVFQRFKKEKSDKNQLSQGNQNAG